MNTFSIKEVLATGWKITKDNFWFLAGAVLIVMVVGNIPSMIDGGGEMGRFNGIGLVQFVLNLFLEIGMIRIVLNLLDGKEASYRNFWSDRDKFLPFLGASVLFGIMLALGFVLLIVPGVIVLVTFGLYSYLIVDKKAGVIEALKMSASLTKGNRWNLFLFLLAGFFINVGGALLLGVGLLWTIPTTTIAFAAIYRKLTGGLTPMVVPATPTPVPTI